MGLRFVHADKQPHVHGTSSRALAQIKDLDFVLTESQLWHAPLFLDSNQFMKPDFLINNFTVCAEARLAKHGIEASTGVDLPKRRTLLPTKRVRQDP